MRPAIGFGVAIGFITVGLAQDASGLLAEARDKILANATHLPKLVCVETIDRSYFSRGDPPDPPPSCEQMHARPQRAPRAPRTMMLFLLIERVEKELICGVRLAAPLRLESQQNYVAFAHFRVERGDLAFEPVRTGEIAAG
jgi:hypothetical protein